MNWIDIIVILLLLFAVVSGMMQGLIVQICSILALIVGIWLGFRGGSALGMWFGVEQTYAFIVGFLAIFVTTIIVAAVASRLIKKVFKFVGLGGLDGGLGALLSVCKYLLIMSLLFGAFESINKSFEMVDPQTLNSSKSYKMVKTIGDNLFPALDWTKMQIDSGLEKLQ